ncbi:hypothetical protein ACFFIX_12490 [Metabacillus herbersteinensis]|uniref:DUF4878 domain-containing protein n=1 Tax=Metabacillus herbersteinensis TaxID=283816 RepID=A0ABV6GEY8_9BACI
MRRRKERTIPIIFVSLIFLGFLIWSLSLFFNQSAPKDVVESFYKYEQEGDFGSAWDLFHPIMKDKFSKNAFVTERSHIYMGHYAVSTFKFELGDSKKLKKWKMSKDGPEFKDPYSVIVEQNFKSKFGTFTIKQEVYVIKYKDEWKVVWEYN